jgi:hypothetical protein
MIRSHVVAAFALALVVGCTTEGPLCCNDAPYGVRVVNGAATSVDVLVDGTLVLPSLPAGQIASAVVAPGPHTIVMRDASSSSSRSLTVIDGALQTLAVVRTSGGMLSSAVLDDTNSVVPAGATKVRVLHFAANAGTLQVYRTQPDYATPISWQFPFNYQPDPDALSAPFFQSTPGTWEIRVWKEPADASGWASSDVRVSIPLASGEKKTVIILDKPGGGVRLETI